MILGLLYALALACALIIAWLGMDFSPSFTAMFLMGSLSLTALGELIRPLETGKRARVFSALRRLLCIAAAALAVPAVLIYAAGDDWMIPCMRIAPIAALAAHICLYVLLYRRHGKRLGILAGAQNLLLLAVAVLALACAVPSPGLWPCGMGLMLLLAAGRLEDFNAPQLARAATLLGMLLCGVFLAAPMML